MHRGEASPRGLPQLVLAVGGGLLWAACFGRATWPLLATVGLVPLCLLAGGTTRRGAFFWAWLHGTVSWLAGIPWIVHTLTTYGQLPGPLSGLFLLLLAAYLGLYHGLFVALGHGLWRRGGAWALAGLPALWVALEWVRGVLGGGFPWNLAAYAWTDLPGALPAAAWIGAWGVSFLLVTANVGLALAWRERRQRARAVAVALAGLLPPLLGCGLAWAGAGGRGPGTAAQAPAPAPPLAARVIQPNIPTSIGFDRERNEAGYQRLFAMSRQACDTPGALVLWPESSAWPYEFQAGGYGAPRLAEDLARFSRESGCGVLFNSTFAVADEGVYNSAFLLAPDGRLERYDKRHLVPWGEYVPLAEVFPFVGTLARNVGQFERGRGVELLGWGGDELGLGICYEVVFPAEVAAAVAAGASVLATISNDAWYGDSAARRQHFRAARFRAAENRRPLLRAAITGVSGIVAADGRVEAMLGEDAQGILPAAVQGRRDLAPFTRAPWLVPLLSALVAGFGIFADWIGKRRPPT